MSDAIFLSCVTSEFGALRSRLASLLQRSSFPFVRVAHQDDFVELGLLTLERLEAEIESCSLVLHIIGAEAGRSPPAAQVDALLERRPEIATSFPEVYERRYEVSYTQWEVWLGLLMNKRVLRFAVSAELSPSQATHRSELERLKVYPTEVSRPELVFDEVVLSLDKLYNSAIGSRPQNLPFTPIGALFKGRQGFLEKLRQSLQSSVTQATAVSQAIHGLGGVGKTRLAVEYAWQNEDAFNALLFVYADSPQALHRNLAELTGPLVLNLEEQHAAEEEVRVAAALRWLQQHPGWFLILDNVDTPEAAEAVGDLLPKLAKGQVVITSRLSHWSAQVQTLELDVLSEQDAAEFLMERTNPKGGQGRRETDNDEAYALELARELGGLALALEQVGAYITVRHPSFEEYLERWRHHDLSVQDWHTPQMQYPRSIATTWNTTLELLDDAQHALLNTLAWLAPAPVRVEWLSEADREPLSVLTDYSLMRWEAGFEAVVMHRVVQEVMRSQQEDDEVFLRKALQLLEDARPKEIGTDVRTWPVLEPLRPHIAFTAFTAADRGIAVPTSDLLGSIGSMLYGQALHKDAEHYKQLALELDERHFGEESPEAALRLSNLAQLLNSTNRFREAEPLMQRVLEIDEKAYGPNHPEVAIDLSNLASLLYATSRLTEAEPLMRRALKIDVKAYGPEHTNVAIRLNNLAQLLKTTNRLTEAEPLMYRALEIDEESYGADHPNVAIDLNNLAQLLKATNRLTEAEPLMRRALQIVEAAYGPDHPTVAIRLNNLALLLEATNRHTEAEPLMQRAQEIDNKKF